MALLLLILIKTFFFFKDSDEQCTQGCLLEGRSLRPLSRVPGLVNGLVGILFRMFRRVL